MKKLEIRLLNYLLLIAMATLMIGIEFFYEINSTQFTDTICGELTTMNEVFYKSCSDSLSGFGNKIIIMFIVLTIVIAIVLMMFMKNITYPIIKIHAAAEKVIDGDLSETISIDNEDEIGQVADAFNALTSNLQEVAAYTQSTCSNILNKLTHGDENSCKSNIDASIKELRSLNEFMDNFQLLK
ncbi:MAG: HAMP domain-containing protein [Gammaproteobacteria bacterium]|nr:HAMP domain-containing protein [Gammaproteobacteria bacterium]